MANLNSMKRLFYLAAAISVIFISCDDVTFSPNDPQNSSNWSLQSSGIANNLKGVFFVDSFTGYAVGNSFPNDSAKIIKTVDGGYSWFKKPVTNSNASFNAVFFFNSMQGFVIGTSGTILRTFDGGNSWENLLNPSNTMLTSITFLNTATGLISGYNGTMLRTTNSGTSWQTVTVPASQDLFSV
ncbi:MAG: YCF48-related protein, partial [Chlorobi bacterium]|nr:YCF48-related protein [Chlorobiota bacterium]